MMRKRLIAMVATALLVAAPSSARTTEAGVAPLCPVLTGCERWAVRHNAAGGWDFVRGIGVSPNGATVFVTGPSCAIADPANCGYEAGDFQKQKLDFATFAYDAATGAVAWSARYGGPDGGPDYIENPQSLAVSADGSRVYVFGESWSPETHYDLAAVAYEAATGRELWDARIPSPGLQVAAGIALSPDGTRVYLTGGGVDAAADAGVAALDAATGERIEVAEDVPWAARYDGPAHGPDRWMGVAVSPDGSRVYAAGESYGSGTNSDYATAAYDAATGQELWSARYNGPGNAGEKVYAMGRSPDGSRLFVTGYSFGAGGSQFDYATVAYDAATGQQLWAARFDTSQLGSLDWDLAYALGVTPDGAQVVVAGYSYNLGAYATVAYDAATGAERWTAVFRGTSGSAAYALAISPDGSEIYVTGQSPTPVTGQDFVTVAYRADRGLPLWAARYDSGSPGEDRAWTLAVSPDGARLFVAGWAPGSGADPYDFATVAYELG